MAKGGPGDDDGIPSFLGAALSPLHKKSVTNALDLLIALGAMDEDTTNLTRLGHCLSHLSVDPRLGKIIVWGYILGCAKVRSLYASCRQPHKFKLEKKPYDHNILICALYVLIL